MQLVVTNSLRARLESGSVALLRTSLGLIFLGFGVLKFVPGLSPAESLAERTVEALTLGLMPDAAAIYVVAALETAIGLSLLTGRLVRVGLALLGVAMGGILAPVVLFPGEMFVPHPYLPLYGPTLAGQYVLKDVVLLAGGLVVAVRRVLGAPRERRADLAPAVEAALAAGGRRLAREPRLAA